MNGCPKCGSYTQLEEIDKKVFITDAMVEIIREYSCDCGCTFRTQQIFICEAEEEIMGDC
jgi:hypothetical protein